MLHGNLLLHGWWVTDVSFYTTELPQYAAIELAHGLSADVMHVAGAMTYTLLVLTAAFLARGRATGPAGVSRALLAAGIMLAPQLGAGTQTLVLSPDHTGTSVPVLLIWLLIDRAPERWYVPVLVWLGLAWTAVADAMTLFVAVVPLAGVLRVPGRAGRARQPRAQAPGAQARALRNPEPPRRPGYELALLAAAVLAIPAELAAIALIKAAGGWQVHGLATSLGDAGRLAGNARLAGQGLLVLFGANVFGAASAGSAHAVAFAVVHLAGVALAVAAVAAAAPPASRRAPRPADLIESVLLAGIAVDLAGYLVDMRAVNIFSTREIAPVLPFAAVLAGRIFGAALLGGGGRARRSGTACAGCSRSTPPCSATRGAAARAAPQCADLAAWLPAHHLTKRSERVPAGQHRHPAERRRGHPARGGPGRERQDPRLRLERVASGGSTRPVTPRTSSCSPRRRLPGAAGGSGITVAEATATFGRPARADRYHAYTILIWPRGENLLARLR